jgi:endonuclease/exonuclease/phosphatase family metal-dependent hydrolase
VTSTRFAPLLARTLLGMAVSAATSVVLVGQFGRGHHTLDQFNSLLSMLLPVLALTLAGALRLRDRASIVVAALGLLVGGYQLGGAALAGVGRDGRVNGETLKILTLSTYHSNLDPAGIGRVVVAQAPDIAVLQETNGTAAQVVNTLLPGYHRIRSCKAEYCTLTILSRWPMRRIKVEWPPHRSHPDVLVGEVDAPIGTFHVINVHLQRPYEKTAQRLLAETANLARGDAAVPLIVAGDFNTATGTFGLDRFARSSGLHRFDGFIPTYPANEIIPAFAGIDHVFANAHWARAGCRRTSAGGSDHYGVACRLGLRAPR